MRVQEFIDLLDIFDRDLDVLIYCDDCTQEFDTSSTKIVEENKEVIIYI